MAEGFACLHNIYKAQNQLSGCNQGCMVPAQHVTTAANTFRLMFVYDKSDIHLGIVDAVSLQLLQCHVQLDHCLVMVVLILIAATVPPSNV